jgi:nitrogen fixation/metabolism regulation signal transduction histidine kinase
MNLRTRIVAALVLAALIPMAVVLAVALVQAEKRANEATDSRMTHAREQAEALVENERSAARSAADRAAESLAADRHELAAVLRGRESVARPAASTIAALHGLDRVEILGSSGLTLAVYDAAEPAPGTAALVERRRVPAEGETLTLVATRALGASFVSHVSRIAGGNARLGSPGAATCGAPYVEVEVGDDAALCVSVRPADARDFRHDLLKSFAGVAPVAFLAALAVGFVLAGRIARPVRELAERAESIAAQRKHPITLLPEKDETLRMTLAFDQMLDALESSERRRLSAERVAAWEEIAKRLAHEIKNPLSPIQLAVENLERTRRLAPGAFDEAFAVETRTILEEVGSLRALVDEFAQFARLPRPRVAPCDPRTIAEGALSLFSARIEVMRVDARIDAVAAPGTIHGDAEQLGRVLKNVIANALDAMEEAALRTLVVTVRREGDRVSFAVADTGRGFDPETLHRVFEPYFTTRADRGGTGLGMAIARRIAMEHGGSLSAAGAPGRGATITLTVPVEGPPSEDA